MQMEKVFPTDNSHTFDFLTKIDVIINYYEIYKNYKGCVWKWQKIEKTNNNKKFKIKKICRIQQKRDVVTKLEKLQ